MNKKYQTNWALMVGPVVRIADVHTGATLGVASTNMTLFLALNKRFRVRSHSDGWFVDGRGHKAQIWEYGQGKLGLTVRGAKLVNVCSPLDWLSKRGIGDQEANFNCPWDDEHLNRLEKLIKLQRRRQSTASDAKIAPAGSQPR